VSDGLYLSYDFAVTSVHRLPTLEGWKAELALVGWYEVAAVKIRTGNSESDTGRDGQ